MAGCTGFKVCRCPYAGVGFPPTQFFGGCRPMEWHRQRRMAPFVGGVAVRWRVCMYSTNVLRLPFTVAATSIARDQTFLHCSRGLHRKSDPEPWMLRLHQKRIAAWIKISKYTIAPADRTPMAKGTMRRWRCCAAARCPPKKLGAWNSHTRVGAPADLASGATRHDNPWICLCHLEDRQLMPGGLRWQHPLRASCACHLRAGASGAACRDGVQRAHQRWPSKRCGINHCRCKHGARFFGCGMPTRASKYTTLASRASSCSRLVGACCVNCGRSCFCGCAWCCPCPIHRRHWPPHTPPLA